jgi:hypothetical protein
MSLPTVTVSNEALWPRLTPEEKAGFHEGWYLKLNDPARRTALWLRFTLLSSRNGFRREAAVWAIAFERTPEGEVRKTAVRQAFDISAFSTPSPDEIRVGECALGPGWTRGRVQSKGREIRWDLKFDARIPGRPGTFSLVPESLARAGLVQGRIATVGEDLLFTGQSSVDGQLQRWEQAPGMQGHLSNTRGGHSWAWAHCNSFVDEAGNPSDLVFEGLTVRARIAGYVPSPRFSSFFFRYKGEDYHLNSIWSAIQSRSHHSLNEWKLKVEKGDLVFQARIHSEYRDFAGLTYEDTDGSLLYCANSKLSDMSVLVYRRGKLEAHLQAKAAAALEVVSRSRNPYVPLLI